MRNFNIAKVNIAFGFILFIFSAGVGPYMAAQFMNQTSERNAKQTAKLTAMGKLQSFQKNGFKGELDDNPELTKVGTVLANAIRALNAEYAYVSSKFSNIKTAHAHGNLESLLNIVVGLVLLFMGGPAVVRLIIGLAFILGALLHSGMMYLVFYPPFGGPSWASAIWQTGIGPILILAGLALAAVASILWLKVPARE